MTFHPIDEYLLDGRPAKVQAIAAVLRDRSVLPGALPFYRALEAVGANAADEALIALRLVLAGRLPDDDAVRRLRGLARLARGVPPPDVFAQAGTTLDDMRALSADPVALAAAAREAYRATF